MSRAISRLAALGTAAAVTVPIPVLADAAAHQDPTRRASAEDVRRPAAAISGNRLRLRHRQPGRPGSRGRTGPARGCSGSARRPHHRTSCDDAGRRRGPRSQPGRWDLELLREDREVGTGAEMARAVFRDLLALDGAT